MRFALRTFAQGLAPILSIQSNMVNTVRMDFDLIYRYQLDMLLQSIEEVQSRLKPLPGLEHLEEEDASEDAAVLQEKLACCHLNLLIHSVELLLTTEERESPGECVSWKEEGSLQYSFERNYQHQRAHGINASAGFPLFRQTGAHIL